MARVLMLGWEYPPHVTGGLAAATAGVVEGLLCHGHAVTLLLPTGAGVVHPPGLTVYSLAGHPVAGAYDRPGGAGGAGLFETVQWYADRVSAVARDLEFDLIHAHEWLTATGAMRIAAETGRPWVFHVHATEFDRAGEQGYDRIVAIEREAVARANLTVAVSEYTRQVLAMRYGADDTRTHVVHNSVRRLAAGGLPDPLEESARRPLVLFLGRLTVQKGPDHFVAAAVRALEREPEILFVVAGEGDLRPGLMARVASLGLGRSILFTGFVSPEDARRLYARADVYVMPSVSEPFGIAALEALDAGTPVILSRGAGVSELVRNALEVDFWDAEAVAGAMLAVLRYPVLRRELAVRGHADLGRWTWEDAGQKITALYRLLPWSRRAA